MELMRFIRKKHVSVIIGLILVAGLLAPANLTSSTAGEVSSPTGGTLSFSASDEDLINYDNTQTSRLVGDVSFSLTADNSLGFDAGGIYAYKGPADEVEITIQVQSGYMFDLSTIKIMASSGNVNFNARYANGETDSFTINGISDSTLTQFASFQKPTNNLTKIVLSSTNYAIFQDIEFTNIKIIPALPTVTTSPASNITTSSAVLNGTVNAQGDSTTISFQYGLTTAYGDSFPATPGNLSSSIAESVSASLSNLSPNTTYSYRIVATNAAGTTNGANQTFTTFADLPGQPQSVGVTAGDGMAMVTFTAPGSNGGAAITGYIVTASPGGITASGISSPISVTGLTNGTPYTFTVAATNSVGTGPNSAVSSSIVPKAPQTITFTNPGEQNFGTTPTISASSTSNLPVSFTTSTPGICSITSEGALTFLSTGNATIIAHQEGNDYFLPASSVSQTFDVIPVLPGAPTGITAEAGDGSATISFTPPVFNGGAGITGYTVTSSPGGITGSGAGSPATIIGLTNGQAYTFTVTATNSVGTGQASVASNSVIPKSAQTITFNNPGAQNFGTNPMLTATASSGLSVAFISNTPDVCTITLGGTLDFITAGTASITAMQAGDGVYLPADPVTQFFTVNPVMPGAPTSVTAVEGDTQAIISFTPPVNTGGTVITGYTVTANPADVAPVSGGSSPIVMSGLTNGQAYTFTVTATNSAGTGPASPASNSVTPRAYQTIAFANPGAQNFGTMPILTAFADSGLSVSFTSDTPEICTITSSGTLTFLKAGTATISANQAGNASYLPAPTVSRTFTVNAVVPGAPTDITAVAGNGQATISFLPPSFHGGSDITGYRVISSPGGITATGISSPIQVSGLTNGTAYTFKVIASNSAGFGAESNPSLAVVPVVPSTGGGTTGGSTQTYQASIKTEGVTDSSLPITVDQRTGIALVDTGLKTNLLSEGKDVVITVPNIPKSNGVTLGIPVLNISAVGRMANLTLHTDMGSLILSSDMLTGLPGIAGNEAQISIGHVDKANLPDSLKAAIGDRPLIRFNLSIDGKAINWNNADSPVTVKIPYKPAAGELQNPGSIVIWYIDGTGKAIPIPNGQFDAATGMVTFRTTHFSDYAVAYNPIKFTDVSGKDWYKGAVDFIAARDITKGTGKGVYSPNATLSRAEFVVLMMRATGLEPDQNNADNFSDAGNAYYTGYLAAAKRLGITEGIGNNQFAPRNSITRQEMASLLYKALKAQNQLLEAAPEKGTPTFADTDKIAPWAKEPMDRLAQLGILNGSAGKLNPTGTTTRAEMAQVLTNLLTNQ